jgi:hypothetical protein
MYVQSVLYRYKEVKINTQKKKEKRMLYLKCNNNLERADLFKEACCRSRIVASFLISARLVNINPEGIRPANVKLGKNSRLQAPFTYQSSIARAVRVRAAPRLFGEAFVH